jgi:hypothetical protein
VLHSELLAALDGSGDRNGAFVRHAVEGECLHRGFRRVPKIVYPPGKNVPEGRLERAGTRELPPACASRRSVLQPGVSAPQGER